MKGLLVVKLSVKTICQEKMWFLGYGPKASRAIRMPDFLNCNISKRDEV